MAIGQRFVEAKLPPFLYVTAGFSSPTTWSAAREVSGGTGVVGSLGRWQCDRWLEERSRPRPCWRLMSYREGASRDDRVVFKFALCV
jgi:hypothetical protein